MSDLEIIIILFNFVVLSIYSIVTNEKIKRMSNRISYLEGFAGVDEIKDNNQRRDDYE